jgi:hypothetical protein
MRHRETGPAAAALAWEGVMGRRLPALTLLLALAACTEVSDFDPVGRAAFLRGSWTIDGAPADATTCDALGASQVVIVFFDFFGVDPFSATDDLLVGARVVPHGDLVARCDLGRINTAFTQSPVVASSSAGEDGSNAGWAIGYQAQSSNRQVLGVIPVTGADGALTPFPVPDATGVPVRERPLVNLDSGPADRDEPGDAPVDFQSPRITASWRVGGASASEDSCGDIDAVRLVLAAEGTAPVTELVRVACSLGSIGVRRPVSCRDRIQLQAIRGSEIAFETEVENVRLSAGEDCALSDGGDPYDLLVPGSGARRCACDPIEAVGCGCPSAFDCAAEACPADGDITAVELDFCAVHADALEACGL